MPAYFSNLLKNEKAIVAAELATMGLNEVVGTGSVSLDWALGGGFPRGRINLIWGPAGSGKSTLALKLMAKELEANPKKYAVWIDTEYSFDHERAEMLGVDTQRVILIQSNIFEGAIAPLAKISEEVVKDQNVCFLGLDSVKGLVSLNEQNQMDEGNVESAASAFGGIAKSVNPALTLLARMSYELQCLTVLTNHAMMNLDPRMSKYYPYILTGGQKLKHICSAILFLDKSQGMANQITDSERKDMAGKEIVVGSLIRGKVTKTRRTVEGKGVQFHWNLETGEFERKEDELIELALGLGILYKEVGNAIHYGPKATAVKGANKSKFSDMLVKDRDLYNKILTACKTVDLNTAVDINAEILDVDHEKE